MLQQTEDQLAKTRNNIPVLRTNLYNAGLTDPGCVVAYLAAHFAGADPAVAFEAARRHMLLSFGPLEGERLSPQDERGPMYATSMQRLLTRIAARRELINQIRDLPNPYEQLPRATLRPEELGRALMSGDEAAIERVLGMAA
jgi:hypothetical protein